MPTPCAQRIGNTPPPSESSSSSSLSSLESVTGKTLQTVRQKTHINLADNLVRELSTTQWNEVCRLIDLITNTDNNFQSLNQHVSHFIDANINDPTVIVNALKYINSQLMILSHTERQLVAQDFHPHRTKSLDRGLNLLIDQQDGARDKAVEQLAAMKLSPVLTAHPTNFNRPEADQVVLSQLDTIGTAAGNKKICRELWQVQGVREKQPTVQEEASGFSEQIRHLHKSSRRIHKQINRALSTPSDSSCASETQSLSKPLFEIGNWVGGDRDGNPNINAQVLHDVVKIMSQAAFTYFESKINIEKDHKPNSLCNLLCKAEHQEALTAIREKLTRTREHLVGNSTLPIQGDLYQNATEFVQELQNLDTSNLGANDKTQIARKLELLKLDAQSIGFHGASTDIRQNSAMNAKTIGGLLRRLGVSDHYETMSEQDKQETLNQILMDNTDLEFNDRQSSHPIEESDQTRIDFEREIELVKSYKTIHDTYGPQALKNCITANTEQLSDMLEVMVLLKYAGLADSENIRMNVVPLIETVDDLHNGPTILKGMLKHDWYRAALDANGNLQQIMVGYSDSNRLDGPLPSSWAVYEGIKKMLDVANQYEVQLHVFHGRGGTEARGSGDSYTQEIQSTNGASLTTGMRQTEQGEEVSAKFGSQAMSNSNLADMVGSTLETVAAGSDQQFETYKVTMEKLALDARTRYGELYQHPELPRFLKSSTPIDFVGKSNAGSRPASRVTEAGAALDLGSLRAIPWVGSWYQSGTAMPAFFGTGTALKSYITAPTSNTTPSQRTTELRTMYQKWPFFKSFIDRTANAMEKADMQIAQQYAELAPAQSREIFNSIKEEFDLTREMILTIKQSSDLMNHNPEAAETLATKKSLIQAAHAMQINLLKKHNEAGSDLKEKWVKPIVMSMQAIASANRFG